MRVRGLTSTALRFLIRSVRMVADAFSAFNMQKRVPTAYSQETALFHALFTMYRPERSLGHAMRALAQSKDDRNNKGFGCYSEAFDVLTHRVSPV